MSDRAPTSPRRLIGKRAWLVLVILGALFLRTYQLADVGLQTGDESAYYGGPARVAAHLRWWASQRGTDLPDAAREEALMASVLQAHGSPDTISGRPIFGLLAVVALLLFGPSPHHFLLMNAVLGVATVGLVFWLARMLWPEGHVALMAALALAVSGFHLIWSRNGFAHVGATFFLTLGLACYVKALWGKGIHTRRWLLAAGVCLGASIAAHQVILAYLGVCVVVELWRMLAARNVRGPLGHLALLGVGVASMLVAVELFTRLPNPPLSVGLKDATPTPFSHTTLALATEAASFDAVTPQMRWSGYVRMPFLYGEGIVFSALILLGMAVLAARLWRRRSMEACFVLCGIGVPITSLLVLNGPPLERNLAPLTPFTALLVGVALTALWQRVRHPGWRIAGLGLFVIVQLLHAADLFEVRSGYAAAAQWLARNGGGIVLVPRDNNEPLWYVNGVTPLFFVNRVREDGRLELVHARWGYPATLADTTPRYAGLVDFNKASPPDADRAWISRIDFAAPVAEFTNVDPFTLKKIKLLKGIRGIVQRIGPPRVQAWVDAQLARALRVVDMRTVRLYLVGGSDEAANALGGISSPG